MNTPVRAAAILTRDGPHGPETLMFRHPLAGVQFVKGRIEPGESPAAAAECEFAEEAGHHRTAIDRPCDVETDLGLWGLVALDPSGLPKTWQHQCADDGGHDFRFFWHPLGAGLPDDTHPAFVQAFSAIRATIR